MSKLSDLLDRLPGVKKLGGTWRAKCPSHSDKTPSLVVKVDNKGNLLLHCFGGCGVRDVMAAVDLPMHHLFAQANKPPPRPAGPSLRKRYEEKYFALALMTELMQAFPEIVDRVRDEAMDAACDFHELYDEYYRTDLKRTKYENKLPHCWWVCCLDCDRNNRHEKGCDGCSKTAEEAGLCREHFAAYSRPLRGRA